MPQAVAAAATAAAAWASAAAYAVATTVGISAATASTISIYAAAAAYAAVGYAVQASVMVGLNAITTAQVPDPESGKQPRKQSRPLRSYLIGTSRLSGSYMLRESTGNKLAVVLALCEGRLASFDRIYLNDDLVTLSGGFVVGMENERYGTGDLIRLDTRLGLPTETHYGFLTADFGTFWPTTSRGDGIASLAFLAQHRSKEAFGRHFPNGEPMPSVVATAVCYDWRDPAQDREDESTWQPSDNPVVWFVHCEWFHFGRSWTRSIAPVLGDLTAEADYCDTTVALKAGGTEPRYRVGGTFFSNTEPGAVRAAILSSMDGWLSTNGKGALILKAGRYVNPSFTVTGEHIEGYSWRAFQPDEEACNVLVVSYVEPDQDYTDVEAGSWRDEAAITATGRERSENLALSWVNSRSQAMRLAKRKMTRVNAERRGQIRTGIFGLNGLGERYIRIQNPELGSMADVVCEVMNVEVDFAASQVVFDVILADQDIDAWDPAEEEGEQPDPVDRPPGYVAEEEPARRLLNRTVAFPLTSTETSIIVEEFEGTLPDGTVEEFPADTITGLTGSISYGVFWKESVGYVAIASPATSHFATGSWIFIDWQSTSDAGGEYPEAPPAPPGSGGNDQAPQPPTYVQDMIIDGNDP